MTNRLSITVAFAVGILFLGCAQLIGIESLGECGDGVIDREGGERCDEGDSDGDGRADETPTCNGDCSLTTSRSCYARCCDGTLGKGDDHNDRGQCIFWGGAECDMNGGPVSIRHGGWIAWPEEQSLSCPTLRACSVRCCDDTLSMTYNTFDVNICRLAELNGTCQTQGPGKTQQVSFDDVVIYEATDCS